MRIGRRTDEMGRGLRPLSGIGGKFLRMALCPRQDSERVTEARLSCSVSSSASTVRRRHKWSEKAIYRER
jgi:hypothetical protein